MEAKYTNTQWTTCGRQLLQNGKTFFIRGVNYAPTPIGEPGRLDMLGHQDIYTRDLKNLRDMKANAVKTYDFYPWVDHIPYLDAAYNNGIDPIHTIFSIWIDQSLMTPSVPIDSPQFKKTILQYYQMAKQTGGHPGTMGYSIGGEMNSITVIMGSDFWNKFEALTSAVRRGLKENNNAQKIITTTFVDDGGATFQQGELHHADVDMWGSNVYQNDYPDFVIPAYTKSSKTKPLLVSEYGAPYSNDKGEGDVMELNIVADALVDQAVQMEQNFNLTDKLQDQVIIGGFIFEYSDEWWKSGDLDEHNLGLTKNYVFPLGYLSEEYFGLFGASRLDDETYAKTSQLDILTPRPTVKKLKQLWSNQPLAGENVDGNCDMKVQSLDVEQIAMNNTPAVNNTLYNGIVGMVLCMGILVIAFVTYRQKKRRALYQSI